MYKATLYARSNQHVTRLTAAILNKYKSVIRIRENSSILDIGIGEGRTAEEVWMPILPKQCKEIVGVDISKEMLEYCKMNRNLPKVTLAELDLNTKRLPEQYKNRFDYIFSFSTWHWIMDIRQGLQNVYHMLRPGGDIFFSFFAERPDDEALYKLSKMPRWSKYETHKYNSLFWDRIEDIPKEYKETMDQIGFANTNCILENFPMEYVSEEIFRDLYLSVNPMIKQVDKNDLDDFSEDYLRLTEHGRCNATVVDESGQKWIKTEARLVVLYSQKPKIRSNMGLAKSREAEVP